MTKNKNDYSSIDLKLYIGNIKLKTYYCDLLNSFNAPVSRSYYMNKQINTFTVKYANIQSNSVNQLQSYKHPYYSFFLHHQFKLINFIDKNMYRI